jgi:hypothetical protein
MDLQSLHNRYAHIDKLLSDSSWQSLEKHSLDDLDADRDDLHEIARVALQMAQELDHHLAFIKHANKED